MELPSTQLAIVQGSDGQLEVATQVPLPVLYPGTVLVKTIAVALQPVDYKMAQRFPSEGAVVGCDFSGLVVRIHPGTETSLQLGDMVCGVVHGSNTTDDEAERTNGAFAEFVRAQVGLLLRVPTQKDITPAQAATLGTALATNALALWADPLALSLSVTPDAMASTPFPVMVYGGSSSVGTMAIQLLRLSGINPVVTSSPHNFELGRHYGADCLFDYVRPSGAPVGELIRKHTGGALRHVLDCAVDEDSVACCYAALGRVGGHYVSLESCQEAFRLKTGRRTVRYHFVMGLESFGKEVKLDGEYWRPSNKERFKAVSQCFSMFQRLLDDGKLMAHPVELVEGNFAGILQGLERLRQGKVSGKKLVVLI